MKSKKEASGLHYILCAEERVKVNVSREVLEAIRLWAEYERMSIAEATWHLLRCGFKYDMAKKDPNTKMYRSIIRLLENEWHARFLKRMQDVSPAEEIFKPTSQEDFSKREDDEVLKHINDEEQSD